VGVPQNVQETSSAKAILPLLQQFKDEFHPESNILLGFLAMFFVERIHLENTFQNIYFQIF